MKKDSARKSAVSSRQVDRELDQAIHRVYRTYGPDLSVFFQAVQRQINLEHKELSKRQWHAGHLKAR